MRNLLNPKTPLAVVTCICLGILMTAMLSIAQGESSTSTSPRDLQGESAPAVPGWEYAEFSQKYINIDVFITFEGGNRFVSIHGKLGEETMDQFYKAFTGKEPVKKSAQQAHATTLVDILNLLGKEGWELMWVKTDVDTNKPASVRSNSDSTSYLFKRRAIGPVDAANATATRPK